MKTNWQSLQRITMKLLTCHALPILRVKASQYPHKIIIQWRTYILMHFSIQQMWQDYWQWRLHFIWYCTAIREVTKSILLILYLQCSCLFTSLYILQCTWRCLTYFHALLLFIMIFARRWKHYCGSFVPALRVVLKCFSPGSSQIRGL